MLKFVSTGKKRCQTPSAAAIVSDAIHPGNDTKEEDGKQTSQPANGNYATQKKSEVAGTGEAGIFQDCISGVQHDSVEAKSSEFVEPSVNETDDKQNKKHFDATRENKRNRRKFERKITTATIKRSLTKLSMSLLDCDVKNLELCQGDLVCNTPTDGLNAPISCNGNSRNPYISSESDKLLNVSQRTHPKTWSSDGMHETVKKKFDGKLTIGSASPNGMERSNWVENNDSGITDNSCSSSAKSFDSSDVIRHLGHSSDVSCMFQAEGRSMTDSTPDSSSGIASDDHCYTSGNSESSAAVSPVKDLPKNHQAIVNSSGCLPKCGQPCYSNVSSSNQTLTTPTGDMNNFLNFQKNEKIANNKFYQTSGPYVSSDETDTGHSTDDNSGHRRYNSRNNVKNFNKTSPNTLFDNNLLPPMSFPGPNERRLQRVRFSTTNQIQMTGAPRSRLSTSSSYFDVLEDETVLRIFSNLFSNELCCCAMVCRRWYKIVWSPCLWTCITIHSPSIDIDRALKCLTKVLSYETPTVCVFVEKIDLSRSLRLTDKGLYTIAYRCPELRHLVLDGCNNISNIALFEIVSRCVNLEHLSLSGCLYVTCISLTPEANIQATTYGKQIYIHHLDMTDCINVDDSALQIIVTYCSRLTFLYLRRCVKVTDIGVQYVASYCHQLQELSISDCRNITDLGMRDISRLETSLRYLSIAKCDLVGDAGVKCVAHRCPKLRYMNMRGCERVTDEAIVYLATRCPRIRSLDIGKCSITDQALISLAELCPQIRRFSVRGCDRITDRGVLEIAKKCRLLQQINIQDCHVGVRSYKAIRHYCQNCVIEHTNPAFY